MSRGFRVTSYGTKGINKREMIERSALRGEWLFGDWHTHVIAFHLCYTFGGEPVYYNDLWGRYLDAVSETEKRFDAFKRALRSLIRKGLVDGENLVDSDKAWEQCLKEEVERSKRDKRLKRSPEERCIEKLDHEYWIQARSELCRLLYKKLQAKPGVRWIRPPPIR